MSAPLYFLGPTLPIDFDIAADALDRLIARAPDRVRGISLALMGYFLRHEPKGQESRNDDRRVALARLGYGGEEGDHLAADAVGILIKRADVAGASELLPYIDDPQAVEDLLIQKRFVGLWPRLDLLAGPRLEKIRAASAGTAERAFAAAPDDHEKLQQLVNALRHARPVRRGHCSSLEASVHQRSHGKGR